MADSSTIDSTNQSMTGAIELIQPEWLWVLPVLLLVTLFWRLVSCREEPASLATGSLLLQRVIHPLISKIPDNHIVNKVPMLNVVVYGMIIISMVISLSGPVRIGEKLSDPPQERDIVFIVDTSISMTLKDYLLDGKRIDRMTLLKGVLDKFIQQLPGERIGIIVFGDGAYTLVPLTQDHGLLRRMLSRIQATMVGRFNNMGEAISLGVKQTDQQKIAGRHRVLVLLTDADKPTGTITPQTAADLALEAGLPLYTIAIGSTTLEAEEQRTAGLIYEPVNNALLTEISTHTGARNYRAGDLQSLEKAVNDIANSETNTRIVPPQYYQDSLYHWPLLLGMSLLCLMMLSTFLKRVFATPLSTASNTERVED